MIYSSFSIQIDLIFAGHGPSEKSMLLNQFVYVKVIHCFLHLSTRSQHFSNGWQKGHLPPSLPQCIITFREYIIINFLWIKLNLNYSAFGKYLDFGLFCDPQSKPWWVGVRSEGNRRSCQLSWEERWEIIGAERRMVVQKRAALEIGMI